MTEPTGKPRGRPKGSASKRTAEIANAAAAQGITPLEYMLNILRDESADAELRRWAAEKAAPYVHARLAAVDHSGSVDLNLGDRLDKALGRGK